MQVLIWIATGVIAGWVAGLLSKGRDYGVSGNLVLGLIGGLVGGWIVHLLGFTAPSEWWRQLIVSLLGAMVILALARRLKPAVRRTTRALGGAGAVADIEAQMQKLGEYEKRAIERLLKRGPTAHDPNLVFEEQMTFGQRLADQVAAFGGSWRFIGLFLLLMLAWMITSTLLEPKSFDPYPYILLNLVLSCLAALQAPVIMMSQNRQAAKDRLMASNDYEVNLKSELELTKLHARLDELRDRDWQELVEMQKRQIALLEHVVRSMKGGSEAAGA